MNFIIIMLIVRNFDIDFAELLIHACIQVFGRFLYSDNPVPYILYLHVIMMTLYHSDMSQTVKFHQVGVL